jgi:GLPGLI family protein
MKRFIITICTCFLLNFVHAQQQFIAKGKIEFEKKVMVHKQLENEEDNTFRQMMLKSIPAVNTSYFDLYFDDSKTMYKPGKEMMIAQKVPEWILGPANDNIVFTNLNQQNFTSQKTVFESTFNINDSIHKLNWKITADTRTIAGFECRKATTIIMDSVYVFAFYTDQITTPGGPESFSGLPGMILGIAIPRMHTTWFATKLELIDIKDNTIIAPKKGKKTNLDALKQQLNSSMKDWGKWGQKNTWQIMI